ncbi:MAG: tRNA pseudouridine(38-40) synthase TruA [Planctomycetota bacterium]|nr:tRNA pseudouridine(38-40) synthase TruA [Planctomycetota bacterium]
MKKKVNVRLTVEYDGTGYAGWQRQNGKPTIQEELERAVQALTGERCHVQGAGRTDAGVHAVGQVANVKAAFPVHAARLVHALNAHLPTDITVTHAEAVSDDFHAQFDARSKLYRYVILNRPARPALERNRVYNVRSPLDLGKMKAAASRLVGRHDFRAFCSEARTKESTVRLLKTLEIERHGEYIVVDAHGEGFLYNMVRAIVGTLVLAGQDKLDPDQIEDILKSRDRRKAGPNAPARGLTLVSVSY